MADDLTNMKQLAVEIATNISGITADYRLGAPLLDNAMNASS
jgi:hypothetical protein